jgi:curved DNA-binding protein CbpA
MDFKKDYYAILGLGRSSNEKAIKAAYRAMVKKYHPDLHPGDAECEERIKAVNEAYEVLGTTDSRFVYDQFKDSEKQAAAAEPKPGKAGTKPNGRNQKTYIRKDVITHVENIYIRGTLFIKYKGIQDNAAIWDVLKEVRYNIRMTEIRAVVYKEDIFREADLPQAFTAAFSAKKLDLSIPQPVKTRVTGPKGDDYYALEIFDLTVPAMDIEGVTKEDGDSYGTLKGIFYGYVRHVTYEEVETEVTECFGETGRKETKMENNRKYARTEYFNSNCTTYWGNWVDISPPQPVSSYGDRASRSAASTKWRGARWQTRASNWRGWQGGGGQRSGCLSSFFNLAGLFFGVLFLLFQLPGLLMLWPFLLFAILLWLLSYRLWAWLFRVAGLFLLGLFVISLIGAFHGSTIHPQPVAGDEPAERGVKKVPVKGNGTDSLISHYRVWKDYDGKTYAGIVAVKKSAFAIATRFKNTYTISATENEPGYDELLYQLEENDQSGLRELYALLDSIKVKSNLPRGKFAEVIVSMVQDIPYAVVLPEACDPALYADQFISKYLASKNARCDGYQKFGINTPVQFLATLNGDCDTRTLLVYTILSHYRYDVVLLSSEFYSHSLIGIDLPFEGTNYTYLNKNYTLWETTAISKPGLIANEIANLDYWRISLKSKP